MDDAFDYEKGVSNKFKKKDYLALILKDVQEVHQ
jgi:hypothetical protein